MDWSGQCAVLIPCLNEAATIASVVAHARVYLSMVLVVDDGSSDRTGELARDSGARVLRHESPRGKGAALKAGLTWLRAQNISWALTMDGDGQHLASDIPAFLARAEATGAPLIVGNRMWSSATMPWLRRKVNQWMSHRLSVASGQTLPDTQCGFRLLNLNVWSSLKLATTHFEVESELLLAMLAARHRVEFVPVQVIYGGESSKIRPVQDTWRWFKWWWKLSDSAPSPLPGAEPKQLSK